MAVVRHIQTSLILAVAPELSDWAADLMPWGRPRSTLRGFAMFAARIAPGGPLSKARRDWDRLLDNRRD